METIDLQDDGLDQLLQEVDQMGGEFAADQQRLDTEFAWDMLYQDMRPILRRFIDHLQSIDDVMEHLPDKDDARQRFLIGTLLGGVVSAYEGMVHDFVDLLMNSDNYKNTERIRYIQGDDLKRLKIKQGLGWDELAARLGKATLNHPNVVARILNSLFKFSVPQGDEDALERLIQMRNDFTHNNGLNQLGVAYEVSWDYLSHFIVDMDELVAMYVRNVRAHRDLQNAAA